MLETYFVMNFMTIMILAALLTMMYVNRDVKIPASNLFVVCIGLMVVLTIAGTFDTEIDVSVLSAAAATRVVQTRRIMSTLAYIIRPCVILAELLIILQARKYRIICIIPAAINAVVYATSLFGSKIAFYISDDNHWHGGPLRLTIYVVLFIYVLILLSSSLYHFKNGNIRKSFILITIVIQALLVGLREYCNAGTVSFTNEIMALCVLEYYIYLTNVYRQELADRLDAYVDEVEDTGKKLKCLTKEVIESLSSAIDAKDEYTHGHASRVAEYSRKLAQMNNKSEQECDEIYYAALLHDVGKIGISDSIITKEGKLTPEEYEQIKKHSTLGMQILENISEFPYLCAGALGHHERYDGTGYPCGIQGDDIPEAARIIAVADAYDAMSSKRSYRDPIPQLMVREEIVKGMGTQFDPVYARHMLHLIDIDTEYQMSEREEPKELSSGDELVIEEYRSIVATGILLTPAMVTLSMRVSILEKTPTKIPKPSLIIFDSADGVIHYTKKDIDELKYIEYGELWLDGRTETRLARLIKTVKRNHESPGFISDNEYKIEAVRIKDHVLVRITNRKQIIEHIIALPDSIRYAYIGLTGEYCRIDNVSVDKDKEGKPEGYIPRIADEISYIDGPEGDIPNVQINRHRGAASKGVEIRDGLQLSFHVKSLPTAGLVWHCPVIDIFCADDGQMNGVNYRDIAFLRFNGEAWECDPNCLIQLNVNRLENFVDWDTWKKVHHDGYDTVVTFKVDERGITVITENAGISIKNLVMLGDIDRKLYAAITGDQVVITNIRIW